MIVIRDRPGLWWLLALLFVGVGAGFVYLGLVRASEVQWWQAALSASMGVAAIGAGVHWAWRSPLSTIVVDPDAQELRLFQTGVFGRRVARFGLDQIDKVVVERQRDDDGAVMARPALVLLDGRTVPLSGIWRHDPAGIASVIKTLRPAVVPRPREEVDEVEETEQTDETAETDEIEEIVAAEHPSAFSQLLDPVETEETVETVETDESRNVTPTVPSPDPPRLWLVESAGLRFVEGDPDRPLLSHVGDANRIVDACVSNGARCALLYAANLTSAFFDVSSGEADEILQQLRDHGVRLAVVGPPGSALFSSRFGELVEEEWRGPHLGVFDTRRAAEEWLRAGEGRAGTE